jgi:hypothetical protein
VKQCFLWAISSVIVFLGAWALTNENDLTYLLLATSPFLTAFFAASVWMVWKWATAPDWSGFLADSERVVKQDTAITVDPTSLDASSRDPDTRVTRGPGSRRAEPEE